MTLSACPLSAFAAFVGPGSASLSLSLSLSPTVNAAIDSANKISAWGRELGSQKLHLKQEQAKRGR